MPTPRDWAHVDEGGTVLGGGIRLCGLTAVLTEQPQHNAISDALREQLLPGREFLHHYDETTDRRVRIAEAIAELPIVGFLVCQKSAENRQQEAARRALLGWLLPRLQHTEQVDQVVIESRAGSDKHDRKLREHLRRSRVVTGELKVDHRRKHEDPLLWLADFAMGSYVSAHFHDESKPWMILCQSHDIEIVTVAK